MRKHRSGEARLNSISMGTGDSSMERELVPVLGLVFLYILFCVYLKIEGDGHRREKL